MGVCVQLVRDSKNFQILLCFLQHLVLVLFLRLYRRDQQIVFHRQVAEQVELLEHHADVLADLADISVCDLLTAVDDLTTVDLFQTIDGTQQRTLAAAGRTAEHHDLMLIDIQTHAVQNGETAEFFRNILEGYNDVVILRHIYHP